MTGQDRGFAAALADVPAAAFAPREPTPDAWEAGAAVVLAAFAPALPTSATGWAHTLALIGRDPRWGLLNATVDRHV
jgi:hypothetical protein